MLRSKGFRAELKIMQNSTQQSFCGVGSRSPSHVTQLRTDRPAYAWSNKYGRYGGLSMNQ